VLAARDRRTPRAAPAGPGAAGADAAAGDVQEIQTRLRAREAPAARFCWQCRKPLHARADRCPFCGETQ
jgi:hypothetical protein